MGDKRVRKKWPIIDGNVFIEFDKSFSNATYKITCGEPDPRCHCDTHHRFCCFKSPERVTDERPVDSHTRPEREPQNIAGPQGKAGGSRSRGHHRRRRKQKTVHRGRKARR